MLTNWYNFYHLFDLLHTPCTTYHMCFSVRMTHSTHVAWRHIFHSFSRIECINDTSHLLWIYHSLNQRQTNDKIMPMQNIQRRIVYIALVLLLYDVGVVSLLFIIYHYLLGEFVSKMNKWILCDDICAREDVWPNAHARLCQQRQFKLFGSMRLMDWTIGMPFESTISAKVVVEVEVYG